MMLRFWLMLSSRPEDADEGNSSDPTSLGTCCPTESNRHTNDVLPGFRPETRGNHETLPTGWTHQCPLDGHPVHSVGILRKEEGSANTLCDSG